MIPLPQQTDGNAIGARKMRKETEKHIPCKHRRREIVDDVELDMCYAIGFERVGDMPCEYCSDRKTNKEKT